jgi:hypothetical protein
VVGQASAVVGPAFNSSPDWQGWIIIQRLRSKKFLPAPAGRARRGARGKSRPTRTCASTWRDNPTVP